MTSLRATGMRLGIRGFLLPATGVKPTSMAAKSLNKAYFSIRCDLEVCSCDMLPPIFNKLPAVDALGCRLLTITKRLQEGAVIEM